MSAGGQAQGAAQSPQGPSTPSGANTIPLVCFICPKNSHFSDLSHLLTHISSKGHLHNVFELTLVREVDGNADLALAEYDTWFAQNGISALLRARKSAREQRDNQQRQSQSSLGHGADNVTAQRQGSRGGRLGRRGRGNMRTSIRGRVGVDMLNDDMMKFEPDDNDEAQPGPDYRAVNQPQFAWHPNSIYPATPTTQFQDFHLEDEDDSSKYEASDLYSPFPPEDTPETVEDDTGALILKGVVYPGMSGFDSATEKDRRMRNQKKDPTVLMKLETNSQKVTRIEEVLDMNLEYQRTRDVYDEPSIDGSEDDDDEIDINEPRIKRRTSQAKSSYASAKRRANARTRQQTRSTGRMRGTRSSARRGRGPSRSTVVQSTDAARRITRSSANRHEQLPLLHNHGVHPNMGALRDSDEIDDEGFRTHIHTPMGRNATLGNAPLSRNLRRQQHEHLQGLALRPGNPNAAFASPTPCFKKSPAGYSGKENHHLLMKSPPSSFNPYLHPSNDSIDTNSYNPLCPQPGDGFNYRMYGQFDEEHKQSTSSSFNPINNSSTYDSTHVPGVVSNSYHHNQPGGDDYPL